MKENLYTEELEQYKSINKRYINLSNQNGVFNKNLITEILDSGENVFLAFETCKICKHRELHVIDIYFESNMYIIDCYCEHCNEYCKFFFTESGKCIENTYYLDKIKSQPKKKNFKILFSKICSNYGTTLCFSVFTINILLLFGANIVNKHLNPFNNIILIMFALLELVVLGCVALRNFIFKTMLNSDEKLEFKVTDKFVKNNIIYDRLNPDLIIKENIIYQRELIQYKRIINILKILKKNYEKKVEESENKVKILINLNEEEAKRVYKDIYSYGYKNKIKDLEEKIDEITNIYNSTKEFLLEEKEIKYIFNSKFTKEEEEFEIDFQKLKRRSKQKRH